MLRIKEILKEKGITQKELAKRIGKSEPNLNKILNGNPTISTLKEVADSLGVHIRDLFEITNKDEVYGHIELNGEVIKIRSLGDIEKYFKV